MSRGKMPTIHTFEKPVTKKISPWVEQTFDAEIICFGMRWLRVKDGFGGRGKREDWIADAPGVCISVSDYYWNGEDFGRSYDSFAEAIKGETREGLDTVRDNMKEFQRRLRELYLTEALLQVAITKMEKG